MTEEPCPKSSRIASAAGLLLEPSRASACSRSPIPSPSRAPEAKDGEAAAVKRLATRMAAGGLIARPDPTDPQGMILMQRRGSASLGAGLVRRELVLAGVACGLIERTKAGFAACAQPAPAPEVARGQDAAPRSGQDGAPAQVNERESPLAWLRRRKAEGGEPFMPDDAFLASERFRADVTRACLMPSVTTNWDRVESPSAQPGPRDPASASDAALAARQRVRTVYRLLGRDMADFLMDVCAFLMPLTEAERRRGWPARSGKLVLRLALTQLAVHYGIATQTTARTQAPIEGWMAPDARAGIDQWLGAEAS